MDDVKKITSNNKKKSARGSSSPCFSKSVSCFTWSGYERPAGTAQNTERLRQKPAILIPPALPTPGHPGPYHTHPVILSPVE